MIKTGFDGIGAVGIGGSGFVETRESAAVFLGPFPSFVAGKVGDMAFPNRELFAVIGFRGDGIPAFRVGRSEIDDHAAGAVHAGGFGIGVHHFLLGPVRVSDDIGVILTSKVARRFIRPDAFFAFDHVIIDMGVAAAHAFGRAGIVNTKLQARRKRRPDFEFGVRGFVIGAKVIAIISEGIVEKLGVIKRVEVDVVIEGLFDAIKLQFDAVCLF